MKCSLRSQSHNSIRAIARLPYLLFALCCLPFANCAHGATLDAESPREIIADKVEYDAKTKDMKTTGNVSVTNESGQRMTLVDAYMDEKGLNAGGRQAEIILGKRTRISADNITKTGDITKASGVLYTACWDCDESVNAWEVSASRLKHDNEQRYIHLYNPVFWAYEIPIFWSPYLSYPDPTIKRKSGFLLPYMNTTNNMGTQFNLPLYLAFSDFHDMTLTPAYLTAENPLWQLEHRLNAQRSSFRTTGSYTHTNAGDDRWHAFNNDLIELGDNARAFLFLQRTSDKTYLQKYGFYDSQPFLDSGARAEMFGEFGYVTGEMHIFQELRALPGGNKSSVSGDILPNIHGVYQTAPLFGDTYASFMGDMIGINNSASSSSIQRMLGQAGVTSPWTIWGGQRVTLSASARYDVYNFNNTDMLNGVSGFTGTRGRFLPSGYAEWSLPLVNTGADWVHVLEPRARFTAMRKLDDPAFANIDSSGSLLSDATLFSANRLSGYDLWENGEYLDYGANWSAFSGDGISVSGFAGQTYDFSPPTDLDPNSGFHYGASDLVGRLGADYKNRIFINNRLRLYNENLDLRHLETTARLGQRNYIEAGYILATQLLDAQTVDRRISEVVAGFGVNMTGRLSLRARTTYNITDSRIQNQNAGVYYDHPCYTLAFEYAKDGAVRTNLGAGENYVGRTTFRLMFSLKLTETK